MSSRIDGIRLELQERKLDALLVSAPGEEDLGWDTRYYLTGFTGSAGMTLVTRDRAVLAADFRYTEQAEREAKPRGLEVFHALGARKEWFPKFVAEYGLGRKQVGIATAEITYAGYLAMHEYLKDVAEANRPEFVPAKGIVEKLRRRKDADELALLQRAIDISDRAYERTESAIAPELTELRAAEIYAGFVREEGGDDISFPTIVAAGPWGAMPHAQPRNELLGADRPIVFDLGAKFAGYCSDLTRTIVLGRPDDKFREVYEIVHDAQQNAIERIEPGMKAADAHRLAQDVIDAAGYGDRFGHGLGHGVGLAVHEDPYLGLTSEDVLEEGMVFTIEPGIYLAGWGGIRIEDVVVLEHGRPRVLSHARKLTPAGA